MRFTSIALVIAVAVMISPIVATAQNAITIELVTNLTDDSTIRGGIENAFVLRYNATGGALQEVYWPANAFVLYSPDGAEWGSVEAEVLPAFSAIGFPRVFVNHFSKTGGTGSFGVPLPAGGGNTGGFDTAGVVLAALYDEPGYGMPTGYNDNTLQIKFHPRREDAGLHICVDTSTEVPGGSWEWANTPTGVIYPQWSGAKCWVIGCCAGKVGDVDGANGDEPTIGDISRLLDYLFLTQTPPDCLEEADVNLSGTLTDPPLDLGDITVGDISVLIDHLFLNQVALANCP